MSRPRADAGGERVREGAVSPPRAPRPGEGCAERPDAGGRGAHQRALSPTKSRAPARRRNRRGMRRSEVSAPWADAPVRPRESQDRVERNLLDGEPGRRLLRVEQPHADVGGRQPVVSRRVRGLVGELALSHRPHAAHPRHLRATCDHARRKLQVELAQLKYLLPRLAQRAEVSLSRLAGGSGGRGPGETRIEVDRRRTRDRLTRRTRVEEARLATRTEVHVADQMFAPLDPTSQRLRFPREREVIIRDTVRSIPPARDPVRLRTPSPRSCSRSPWCPWSTGPPDEIAARLDRSKVVHGRSVSECCCSAAGQRCSAVRLLSDNVAATDRRCGTSMSIPGAHHATATRNS